MISVTSSLKAVESISYESLRAFSDLFAAYCTDFSELADHFAGDWRAPEARRKAADRAAAHERDRETLVEVLLEQNAAWGLDAATRSNIEALAEPDTVAVVTGQQTGFLGGPLYTPAKLITTMNLAARLSDETSRRVVPVFWLEGEDHDFEEMASTHVLRRNELVELRYAGHTLPEQGSLGAVGRLRMTEAVDEALEKLDEALPPSDFKPEVMEAVQMAYRPGERLEDAFARLLRALFPNAGFVMVNPDEPRLKKLALPLFQKEISNPAVTAEAVNRAGRALQGRFHQQVRARATNLFYLEEEARLQIDFVEGGFRLRGTDRRFTQEELLSLAEKHPERLSPNVVLRPLMQDWLLPTAAYVAGPSEVAYFAQYRSVYEWAGIPMPVIYPRASLTIVESKVQKVLEKYDLTVADVQENLERLFQRVVLDEMEVDVEEVFQNAARPIHQSINGLKDSVATVDQTLGSSVEATRAAVVKEMSALKDRVVRAEKRNHEEVRAQLEKASVNLFPLGAPQERVISVLYFLNKYGLSLLPELEEALSLDTSAHQVVRL